MKKKKIKPYPFLDKLSVLKFSGKASLLKLVILLFERSKKSKFLKFVKIVLFKYSILLNDRSKCVIFKSVRNSGIVSKWQWLHITLKVLSLKSLTLLISFWIVPEQLTEYVLFSWQRMIQFDSGL